MPLVTASLNATARSQAVVLTASLNALARSMAVQHRGLYCRAYSKPFTERVNLVATARSQAGW